MDQWTFEFSKGREASPACVRRDSLDSQVWGIPLAEEVTEMRKALISGSGDILTDLWLVGHLKESSFTHNKWSPSF